MERECTRELKTHVEDATSPIEADAAAPSPPTIAASMYCIATEEICAIIPGTLNFHTKRNF